MAGLPSVPSSEPLPLDAVGSAFGAFGLRKLRSAYASNLVRLRRTDNTEQDIGADSSGALDRAAIATFVGANDAWVVTWYDQSGNGRNLTNATAAEQPQLVAAGVIANTVQFRGDALSATVPSTENSSLTVCAAYQGKTSWWTNEAHWFKFNTNVLLLYTANQSTAARSYSTPGGSSTTFNTNNDRTFTHVRRQIVTVRFDSGTGHFFNNGVKHGPLTITEHGAASTTMQVGTATAGHDVDISELIVYASALSDAQVESVYRAMNQHHLIGPQHPVPTIALRDRWPFSTVIRKWIQSIPESDLDVMRGNLSWDGTYADTDDLMRMYLVFFGGHTNYTSYVRGLLAHSVWFRILPDPNGSGGLEVPGEYRMFTTNDHGTGAGTLALMYSNSLPKAAGAEGNPYYRQAAVARRACICAATSLIRFMTESETNAESYNHTYGIGGNLGPAAFVYRHCSDVLPKHVQNAYLDLLYFVCQRLWWLEATDLFGNMDAKAVAALAECSAAFPDTARKTVCAEAAKRILFGSTTGTPATSNKTTGVYSKAGYLDEGDSPETTYNGHSLNLILEAYRVTYGDSTWSFLQDVVDAMILFKSYQYFPDPDGFTDGPSGYAGRTGGSYVFDQGTEAWRQHNIAAANTAGRHIGDTLGDATAIDALIDQGINSWNNTSNIDDTCVLASGTASAHTGGSASTTVTLTGGPDLSGLIVANNSSEDWRAYLWMNVNGGRWSQLTAFDNTAKTVTGNISFNVASGSPVNYRIEKGPKVYSAYSTWWPPENYYPVPDGYYDAQRALIVAADSSLQTPWEASANHNVTFGDEFWSYKNNDGSRDFGFFVEAVASSGLYSGWYGGTLQQFWTRDTGTVICARHDKSGEDYPTENTRVWSVVDSWATTHVYGIDDADKGFSTAALNGVVTSPSSTFDINGTPKSVEHEATIQGGVTNGFEAGTSISGTIFYRNTFEALSDGVRHLVEVTYTGSDDIKELWATIPVYLRDTDQSMSDTTIEYWNGSAWATLSTTLVSTDAIRLMRNFGSGAKYAYIEFAAAKIVKLNAAVWVQSYQGNSRHRMIKIDLLGYTGSAKAFPASAGVDYSVVTTNPHP
jgi:hypothetical protein